MNPETDGLTARTNDENRRKLSRELSNAGNDSEEPQKNLTKMGEGLSEQFFRPTDGHYKFGCRSPIPRWQTVGVLWKYRRLRRP